MQIPPSMKRDALVCQRRQSCPVSKPGKWAYLVKVNPSQIHNPKPDEKKYSNVNRIARLEHFNGEIPNSTKIRGKIPLEGWTITEPGIWSTTGFSTTTGVNPPAPIVGILTAARRSRLWLRSPRTVLRRPDHIVGKWRFSQRRRSGVRL